MASTRRRTAVAVGAAALTAIAVGLAAPAFAETVSGRTDSAPSTGEMEQHRTDAREAYAQALADELGLDAATVSDAIDKVGEDLAVERDEARLTMLQDRLAAAVAEGTLTQE